MSTDGMIDWFENEVNEQLLSEYVPRSRKRRKQMNESNELERAAVKYDEAQKNRVWF